MTEAKIWTIRKILEWTKGYLAEKGIENARLESEWLLAHSLSLDRVGLYVNFDKPLHPDELAAFRGLVVRRARREPLQYILGTQEFRGREFEVARGVLIPRHDTEVLVAEALRRAPQAPRILDVGAGSGCVAISLAKELPGAEVFSVDVSDVALDVARRNAERLGARVDFRRGSFFEPFAGIQFDLVVSNPPYIPTADLGGLQPEVRDFEPRSALDGGADGLDFYRAIIAAAPQFLVPGGWCMVEIGIGQAAAVTEIFRSRDFGAIFTAPDPAGIDRVVGGVFPAA